MLSQEEDTQILSRLGLTCSQAKIYLALVLMGKASGKTIWKHSGVARQDIYRVLNELQDKGLVEKTLSKPTEFRATPIQEGLKILLSRKNKEYTEIEEKTSRMSERLKYSQEVNHQDETTQFYLTPAKEASTNRIKQCLSKAHETVDIVVTWNKFLQLASTQKDDLMTSLNKGAKFRWLVTKPENLDQTPTLVQECIERFACEMRQVPLEAPETTVALFDKKEVIVATETKKQHFLDSDTLWSNNPTFASTMQHYFDLMWEKSIRLEAFAQKVT
jgi:sugar-specific transcriptional regulator TrmB